MPGRWSAMTGLAVGVIAAGAGCCVEPRPPAFPFVPMQEAVARVNANNGRLAAAPGLVEGTPVTAAVRLGARIRSPLRSITLSGKLVFRKPRDLLLRLHEGAGNTIVMQVGSNDAEFWCWVPPEINTLWWGEYPRPVPESLPAADAEPPATQDAPATPEPQTQAMRPSASLDASADSLHDMPIRADQLLEVLGLNELPVDTTGPGGPVYRPEPMRNVLIFIEYDPTGQAYIEKEYHLDRAPPYLVREVCFRDTEGRVQMHAVLNDYRSVIGEAALAAHRIRIEWPSAESWIELRIARYKVGPGPWNTPENPRSLGVHFKREVRVRSSMSEEALRPVGGDM